MVNNLSSQTYFSVSYLALNQDKQRIDIFYPRNTAVANEIMLLLLFFR